MKIEIRRYRIRGEACDARLYVDGNFVCDCAENAAHRAPQGTYCIALRYCREAKRKVPILIPSDGCMQVTRGKFPIIKIGNGIHTNLNAQIIVGTYRVPGVVIHSRDAFLPLYDRINNSMRRGNVVCVTITEKQFPQPSIINHYVRYHIKQALPAVGVPQEFHSYCTRH